MALTWDQISGITSRKFIPKLVDNIFQAMPLLDRMKKKNNLMVDGGLSIMMPLGYAVNSAAGSYSGADTLLTSDNDVITSAEYTWRQYYSNITVIGRDELRNSGDSAKLNFVKEKTAIAERSLSDVLSTDLYNTGTNGNSIGGLRLIVNTTSTVGGIDQSSYSWWNGQVDSTTTVLSMPAMQTQYNAASIGNDTPTVGLSNRTVYNLYYNLLQPQQRFMDSETAKGGFSSLMFNSMPIIADSYSPSSHLWFLNENYLKFVIHSDRNFIFEPFLKPVNQDLRVAKILYAGNLCCTNVRMQAKYTAIAS